MRLEHLLSGTVGGLKACRVVKCEGFIADRFVGAMLFSFGKGVMSSLTYGECTRLMMEIVNQVKRDNTQVRASGGCLWLLVARKDVASDEMLRGPAGRG